MRTCPNEQAPGRFTTTSHWVDPFELLGKEDPDGTFLASVLAQAGVDARYAGASMPNASRGEPDHVEGVRGQGDAFMLGESRPELLPPEVVRDVQQVSARLKKLLGPVRLEWVHDGAHAWIVQLHVSSQFFAGEGVLSPGDAALWLDFEASSGLDELRQLIATAEVREAGIRVHGDVGLTSHVGDLLRRAHVPGRLVSAVES